GGGGLGGCSWGAVRLAAAGGRFSLLAMWPLSWAADGWGLLQFGCVVDSCGSGGEWGWVALGGGLLAWGCWWAGVLVCLGGEVRSLAALFGRVWALGVGWLVVDWGFGGQSLGIVVVAVGLGVLLCWVGVGLWGCLAVRWGGGCSYLEQQLAEVVEEVLSTSSSLNLPVNKCSACALLLVVG
ncbi:hypothetical protein U1Q18_035220, partial [Sarracenia purpurea var. burkii]